MRTPRAFFKHENEGIYLHLYNHTVSSLFEPLPLGDFEKEKLIEIFDRYKVKYNIEVISLVILGNHFHSLMFCPPETFTKEEAFAAYNKFHKKEKAKFLDDFRVIGLMKNSNNFSEYMREVQREFAIWYNEKRTYKRSGALWQGRFKSQLIETDRYLWACLKYIEMNPVRAGITQNPGEYTYGSFGRWQEKHPYEKNFIEHILSLSGKEVSMPEFKSYLADEMKIMHANDLAEQFTRRGELEKAKKIRSAVQKVRSEQDPLIAIFSDPKWHRHKVLGSKEYIEQKYQRWALYKNSA